jgi:hypothetical protein
MSRIMTLAIAIGLAIGFSVAGFAADDSKVKSATGQVQSGARKIGEGQIGQGVEDTAKGIGNTIVEGAKYTGEKLKESGKAAEPKTKSAWQSFKDSASAFGSGVKNFFTTLFD